MALPLSAGQIAVLWNGGTGNWSIPANWNPNALPVLTDVEGTIKYEDLVYGVTVREVSDEKTGVSSKVVMDSRGTGSKNAPELRPAIVILRINVDLVCGQ